jgi:hypothetical protein
VGRWTAECVLLRGLGRFDTFPGDDVGARNRLALWLGRDGPLDYDAVKRAVNRWQLMRGWCTFTCCWQASPNPAKCLATELNENHRPRRAARNWIDSIITTPIVRAAPMLLGDALPQESGKTSAPTSISWPRPPAPSRRGEPAQTCSPQKAGTAIKGLGRLVKMLQAPPSRVLRLVARTSPTASPSGMMSRAQYYAIVSCESCSRSLSSPFAMGPGK